jgi:hypothetical protein
MPPGTVAPPLAGTPGAPGMGTTEGAVPPGGAGQAETGVDVAAQQGFGGSTVGGPTTAAGYVDSAIPLSQYRLRFDAGYDDNRPDRADFFYPKCGCFRVTGMDPNAPGPGPAPARRVDFQILSNYLEYAINNRFSVFGDIPVRWVDIAFTTPGVENENHKGLSDIEFGFKYAMLYEPCQVLTFQWRTYAPSGRADFGLGRNNWNLEPALLYYRRLSERSFVEAELRDFIPVASEDDFAGNVLRYGFALSYIVYNTPTCRVIPVSEIVGWSVLTGKESAEGVPVNASGDTIVNAKIGLRVGFGEMTQPGFVNRADVYFGYGRALTGDVWYKDIWRAELRIRY